MPTPQTGQPLLIELDAATWTEQLDRAEQWFGNVLMTQATFRSLAEDTLDKVHEPHLRAYLTTILDQARTHEQQAEALFRLIGRDPARMRKAGGALMAKAREAMADVMGVAGGAAGAWRDLHQLLLASLNATSAFGAAQQLGLALGLPDVVELAFGVVSDKFAHHRQLQELVLDMAPMAILYEQEI